VTKPTTTTTTTTKKQKKKPKTGKSKCPNPVPGDYDCDGIPDDR
jgi:hypothetical protein